MACLCRKAIMTSDLRILFLGTGTSTGVPLIGCKCPVCQSKHPHNKRLRSSIIVEAGGTRVLVDSSPDLRQQALREGLSSIDAVIYTHCHLDHVAGFDDMRAFCWHKEEPLPLYASPETMIVLKQMYPWAFSPDNVYRGYVRPEARIIEGGFRIGALEVSPVPVIHAQVETFGYVFTYQGQRIGYASDVKSIPDSSMELFRHLDVLILDSLRINEHPTHLSLDETLSLFRQLKPKACFLTHMSHDMDAMTLSELLPEGVFMAYDGLTVCPTKI
ncbi:MAG: MBL fold metallo-hydrolase [Akkermansia sp.]